MACGCASRAGVTLIELMVTLTLLFSAVILVVRALAFSADALEASGESLRAHMVLKDRLDAAMMPWTENDSGEEGIERVGGMDFRWRVTWGQGQAAEGARAYGVTARREISGREYVLTSAVRGP